MQNSYRIYYRNVDSISPEVIYREPIFPVATCILLCQVVDVVPINYNYTAVLLTQVVIHTYIIMQCIFSSVQYAVQYYIKSDSRPKKSDKFILYLGGFPIEIETQIS